MMQFDTTVVCMSVRAKNLTSVLLPKSHSAIELGFVPTVKLFGVLNPPVPFIERIEILIPSLGKVMCDKKSVFSENLHS